DPRRPPPAHVLLVPGGGGGAGWSAWLPAWAPTKHAYRATRRVRPAGEPLPECGPDGCIVPWMRKMPKILFLRPDDPDPGVARGSPAPPPPLPERPVIGLISNGKPLAKEL